MNEIPKPTHTHGFQMRFEGRLADQNEIPANVLTQALQGAQRAVYLLAMEHEKIQVRQREKLSRHLESRYALICSPPKAGSVAIETRIGDQTEDLIAPADAQQVENDFRRLAGILSSGDTAALSQLVPDSGRRKRLLEAVKLMLPPTGSGIRLSLYNGSAEPFFRSEQVEKPLEDLLVGRTIELDDELVAVTGRLVKIDFDAKQVTLQYPVTKRNLECYYLDSVEDMLWGNRRELIQVIGYVTRDEDDHPRQIRDVEDIREVDLSPFHLYRFQHDGIRLRLNRPLVLEPELDESQQLQILRHPALGIDVFGYTREELDEALNIQMIDAWQTFAQGNSEEMTEAARELRSNLLETLTTEVSEQDAAR